MGLSMYERKMSEIVLHCLGKENTPFAIRIDENELVDFLKVKIKELLQLEYPAIKTKLWRVNIPCNEETCALDIRNIANKVEMFPIRKIKDYKDCFPLNTNDIHVFVEQPSSTKKNTGKVHVFVDNSNLFIGAKYAVGEIEKVYDPDKPTEEPKKPNKGYMKHLQIDYGFLLTTVLDKRELGSNPVIVGSRPPPQDTLWNQIEDLGYDVTVYNRNPDNKEKCVDMSLGVSMVSKAKTEDPGIIALVAGDGDYEPVLESVLKDGWLVEIWFWNYAVSSRLKEPEIVRTNKEFKVMFKPLDIDYQYFTYCCAKPTVKRYILEAKHETIRNWKNEDIMKCYIELKIFCWWSKEDDTIEMYFTNKTQLEKANHWFNNNFPGIVIWNK